MQEKFPMISVIVPIFNEEKKIVGCLNSILNQTYPNIEVVVVYFESSDRTMDIIKSFHDSRIRLIVQETKTGPGGARNLGIENARGEYIGFVEAEEIVPDYYERLYSRIKKDNSDIAIGTIRLIKPGYNIKITDYPNACVVKTLAEKLEAMKTGACFDKLFRASLIIDNNIRFPEVYRWEDNAFLIKALYYSNSVSLVPDCNYVWYPQEWQGKYAEFLKNSIIPIAQNIMDFVKTKDFSRKELNILRLKMFKNFAKSYILSDNIYKEFNKVVGFSWSVSYRYWQMRKREFREKILSRLYKEKKND